MKTKPLYNALFAIAYIAGLVTAVNLASTHLEGVIEESIFLPMGFLGILVLSVALMAYLFFYQPIMMLLDGRHEEAVKFFLYTVATFAAGVVILILVALVVGFFGPSNLHL